MKQKTNLLSSLGVYYFRPDFEYVLQGLCFEHTPRGVYVSTLCFPLFDSFGINLTLSKRLEQHTGFVENGSMTEEAAVDFVLGSPEVRGIFARTKSIDLAEFMRNIESLPYDWQRTRIAPIYVASMLLLGHEVRTTKLFQSFPAASVLGFRDLSAWERLQTTLQHGSDHATALLDQVCNENLGVLGLVRGASAA